MLGLLEQTKFVNPRDCCISFFFFFFFKSNTRCFLLIPLSQIFGVQILEKLSWTWILWKCKTSTRFFGLKFTPTLMVTPCLKMLLSNCEYQGLFLFPSQPTIDGVVRFPFRSLLTYVLKFFRLIPDKFMPNLFRVVWCVEKFNRQFDVKLTYRDINYIHNCCSNLSSGNYIKVHQGQLRQILCLPSSKKNHKRNS